MEEVTKRREHIAAIKAQPLTWAPTEGDGLYLYRGHELVGFVPHGGLVALAKSALEALPR